jgi:hypothetical protein
MPSITKTFEDVITLDDNQRVRINYEDMYFEDTHLLSPAANYFKEHGYYTNLDPVFDKRQFENYWDEEVRRCLEGYTAPNGTYITGYHYHYLNYCPIDRAVDEEGKDGNIIFKRKNTFPAFYDGDFLYFGAIELARSMNKHLNLLKARRKGYSYKNASMCMRNYYHISRSKNFILAGDSKYLNGKDAILNKCWEFMSHIDEYTPWWQPKIKDQTDYKKSGYEEKIEGRKVEKGKQSLVAGLSLHDNPDAVRGAAGELILWEESGKFPELLDAWEIAMPLVKQGAKTLGIMISFGTGGTEGADFTSAEALFERPSVYDCLVFDNIWDDGAQGTDAGFFHPNRLNLDGFINKDGNSDMESAAEYEQRERQNKKKGDSTKAYQQYVAEHAEKPSEAVLASDANQFPTQELNAQYNRVKAKGRTSNLTPGILYTSGSGEVRFKPSSTVKPILNYPHSKKDDLTGAVCIKEAPFKDQSGRIPKGLYIICHDPYAHDSSTNRESLGAAYVIKRTNNFSPSLNGAIVASYVGRPGSQDEYNKNLFMLAEYYGAKIGFENDRGDVIGYAKRFKRLHMLEEEFEILDKKDLQSPNVNRNYGMHMTTPRIDQGELYIRDWLNTVIGKNAEGHEIKILHTIYDTALLKELTKYNNKGNFDRVRALMVGMYYDRELFNHTIAPTKRSRASSDPFFTRMTG